MSKGIAVVTGASGDIGQAISVALADARMHVVAVGRNCERLSALGSRRPEAIEEVAADLTQECGRAAVASLALCHRKLDMLVLASGIYERSHDPAVLARQLEANVHGPYALLRMVLPLLEAASGQIVFINSSQGISAQPGVGQFAATQHAMRAIADSLRAEMNERGLRVTSIFLGRTATTRQARIFEKEERSYTPERLIQPDDVAFVVRALMVLPPTAEITDIHLRPRLKS